MSSWTWPIGTKGTASGFGVQSGGVNASFCESRRSLVPLLAPPADLSGGEAAVGVKTAARGSRTLEDSNLLDDGPAPLLSSDVLSRILPSSSRSSRSSMETLKSSTPRMDPCGTPPYTGSGLDQVLLTLTVMVLLDKKVANSLTVWELAPFLAKARRQC